MRVVKSCLLELREHKGKRIVCQLNLGCSAGDGEIWEETQTMHWLEKAHWKIFNEQLKHIVDNLPDKSRGCGNFKEQTFQLNEEVHVQVRKSATAVKTLLELLGHLTLESKDNILALDFSIERKKVLKESPKRDVYSPLLDFAENLEYMPEPVSTVNTSADSSGLHYVPSSGGKCDLGSDDPDQYTPTKVPTSPSISPIYKPKRIQKTNGKKVNKETDIFANSTEDEGDSTQSRKKLSTGREDEQSNLKKKDRKERKHHRHEHKYKSDNKRDHATTTKTEYPSTNVHSSDSPVEIIKLSTSQDDSDNIDLMEYVKPKTDKTSTHNEEKVKPDRESKSKSRHKHEIASSSISTKAAEISNKELRRSNRSPVKPQRYFVCAESESSKKIKKPTKDLMRKCFGSDAESDDFVEKTPVKLVPPKTSTGSAHTSSASSSGKKRKREEKSGHSTCQQEKQTMSKWLSKKTVEDLSKSPKKSSKTSKSSRTKETKAAEATKSSTPPVIVKRIYYPSAEEIAENERREQAQMRVNENMENILKDLIHVPKKVEILSLNDMSADEILNTFTKYKDKLDEIFYKLRSKPKVTGYNGINHYSVIELIDNSKQLKMMQKLGEVYEKDIEGTSLYSTLFANALMPEWLVHIFKDKFGFTHNEAVTRLEEQLQYMQYMDVEEHQQ